MHSRRLLFFFNFFFFEKFSVKQLGSKSGWTFVEPDLGPSRLQTLSADDTLSMQAKS